MQNGGKSCPFWLASNKSLIVNKLQKEKKQLWHSLGCFPGCVLEVVLP